MTRPDILLTHPLFHVNPDTYQETYHFHCLWKATDPDAMIEQIAGSCRAVIVRGEFNGQHMDALPELGLIAVCGVGYDAVDVQAALERNIKVTHTPDVLTEDVADLALGLMLAAGRKIVQADKYVRKGLWSSQGEMPYNQRVQSKRVGIIGLGRIGMAIARRCEAMNMEIGYHNRNPKPEVAYPWFSTPSELASWADYLLLATPGGASTYHIINQNVLRALGSSGILINVGRGTNVDHNALQMALKNQTIAGAALDVIEGEPNIPDELLALEDNLILQPHQASATYETRQDMVNLTLENINAFLHNQPIPALIPECR